MKLIIIDLLLILSMSNIHCNNSSKTGLNEEPFFFAKNGKDTEIVIKLIISQFKDKSEEYIKENLGEMNLKILPYPIKNHKLYIFSIKFNFNHWECAIIALNLKSKEAFILSGNKLGFEKFIRGENYKIGKNISLESFIKLFLEYLYSGDIINNINDLEGKYVDENSISTVNFINKYSSLISPPYIKTDGDTLIEFWARFGAELFKIRLKLSPDYNVSYEKVISEDLRGILHRSHYSIL